MNREHAKRLLARIGFVQHPCDLDLLLFFVRHPRSLVTSEQIALYLGYDLKRIGHSLDTLIAANALTRSQSPAHAARLYVLSAGGSSDGWLPPLIETMSTREGRQAMREAIDHPPNEGVRRSLDRPADGKAIAAETSRRKK